MVEGLSARSGCCMRLETKMGVNAGVVMSAVVLSAVAARIQLARGDDLAAVVWVIAAFAAAMGVSLSVVLFRRIENNLRALAKRAEAIASGHLHGEVLRLDGTAQMLRMEGATPLLTPSSPWARSWTSFRPSH